MIGGAIELDGQFCQAERLVKMGVEQFNQPVDALTVSAEAVVVDLVDSVSTDQLRQQL